MRYLPLISILLASCLWGQQAPAPAQGERPRAPQAASGDEDDQQGLPKSASSVPADAAVITVKGLCPSAPPPADAKAPRLTCRTLITKAQFEALADAILVSKQAARLRQLAESYPSLLVMAQAAEGRGLDKSPRVQQRLAFARLQILSQELVRQIEEEAGNITKQDVDDYYREHAAEFETANLERVFVPDRKRGADGSVQKDSEAEMTDLAEKLRARAAAGESFAALQKDAYEAAGRTEVPPNPSLGQIRRSGIPASHAAVFDLKPGEVSPVLSDASGHYIYKLDGKETESSDKATSEIRRILKRQRRDKAIQEIQRLATVDLNTEYFGEAPEAGAGAKP